MTTPGAIKRYLNGTWAREGSYALYAPTTGDLPSAPDDNGIWAFRDSDDAWLYSLDGSWVPFTAGGGGAAVYDRAHLGTSQTGLASGWNKVNLDTVTAGTNFSAANGRWVCPTSGRYEVYGATQIAVSAQTRLIASVWKNGAEVVRGTDYLTQSNNGNGIVSFIEDFTAGDYLELYCYTSPAATNILAGRALTFFGLRLLGGTGAQGPTGAPGAPGAPYGIYANYAALPQTGLTAGQMATTADTGTLWVWAGTYWRPMIAPQQFAVGFVGGTVPTSGSLALGTISIPAATYPRWVFASGTCFMSGATAATQFQFWCTTVNGYAFYSRGYNNGAVGMTYALSTVGAQLAANTAGTVSYACAYSGGTAATGTVTADNRFSRGDVMVMPV